MTKPLFLTDIETKSAHELGPRFVRFTAPLRYYSCFTGYTIVIPVGFPSDLATFAIKDFQLRGQTDRPAAIHDFLYATGEHSRLAADLIFYEGCRAEGMGKTRAIIRFLAVRLCGLKAWLGHRKGKTHAAKWLKTQ